MSSAKTYAEIRKKRIEKYLRDYGDDTKAKATAKALHTVKMSSDEKAAFRKSYIAANGVPKSKEAIAAYRRALQDERARKKITYEQEAKDAGVDIDKIRKDARDKFKKALERDKKLKEERDAAIQAMIEAEGYDEVAEPPARPSPSPRPAPADTESKTEESDASDTGLLSRAASYVRGGGESEEAKAAREEKEQAARELAAAQKEAKRQEELMKQAEEKAKKAETERARRAAEREKRQQAEALAAAKKAEQEKLAAEKALAEAAAAKRKAEELKRQAAAKEEQRMRIAAEQKALAEKAAQKEREEQQRRAAAMQRQEQARQEQAQARKAPAATSSSSSLAAKILAKYGPNGPGYSASDNPLKTMLDNGAAKGSLKELAVRR